MRDKYLLRPLQLVAQANRDYLKQEQKSSKMFPLLGVKFDIYSIFKEAKNTFGLGFIFNVLKKLYNSLYIIRLLKHQPPNL